MRTRLAIALVAVLVPAGVRADPVTIVDTGAGPSGLPAFSFYSGQWLAAEFDVGSPTVITGMQGWMQLGSGGALRLALYSDGGDVPGSALAVRNGVVAAGSADWRGFTDLAWPVSPGTYWVGFEVPAGSRLSGSMPFPSPRPLPNGAAAHGDSGMRYFSANDLTIGVRIFGEPDPAPVPEPASMLLLGGGLACLAARRRMRRR